MTPAVLTELNVFPLKSGGGTSLESAELASTGLRHDREFMLVNPDGRHLSQREHPELALVRPSFDGRLLTVSVDGRNGPNSSSGANSASGATRPAEPLLLEVRDDGPVRDVTVHRKACLGIDQGDAAAAWFSAWLGTDCRLVRFTGTRPTGQGGGVVAYADGYPLLVISAESLADLNTRPAGSAERTPLPMNRFRPNLVIEGLGAYAEDTVRALRIGPEVVIEMIKPCARCLITTIDQETGVRGHEPLRTLAAYRSVDRGLMFGQNCVPRAPGVLRVGDRVEVLERAVPAAEPK